MQVEILTSTTYWHMFTCWVGGGVGTGGTDVESSAPSTVSVPDKVVLPVP